jgi:hypothetical protein
MERVRIQSETSFRGHLLLAFIATVIQKKMRIKLKNSSLDVFSLFLNMRNQKCKVYDDHVATVEPYKKAKEAYDFFKIKCPIAIERPNQS